MKLPRRLKGRKDVVIDTMLFIYLFEDHRQFAPVCEFIIEKLTDRTFSGVLTPITMAEVLIKPLQENRTDIAERYQSALKSLPNLTHISINSEAGAMAGALRAKYNHPLPDLFQVAAALQTETPTLITNDKALTKIDELEVFLLHDFQS